jgi:hypothetical protein
MLVWLLVGYGGGGGEVRVRVWGKRIGRSSATSFFATSCTYCPRNARGRGGGRKKGGGTGRSARKERKSEGREGGGWEGELGCKCVVGGLWWWWWWRWSVDKSGKRFRITSDQLASRQVVDSG